MTNARMLIVEHDLTISEEILIRFIEKSIEIVGTKFSAVEAIEYLRNNEVDIVLIDASLYGEISAFDLADFIKNNLQIPYVFMVSEISDKQLNKAKKLNPGAILTMPYSYEQVKISIEVALENHSTIQKDINNWSGRNSSVEMLNNCLFLRKNSHFEKVNFDDILWFKADGNYTIIHTAKGKYIYSTVLKKMEEKLSSKQFVRVHRSYIINLLKIDGFEGNMIIIDNTYIPVTKDCWDKVFDLLHVI